MERPDAEWFKIAYEYRYARLLSGELSGDSQQMRRAGAWAAGELSAVEKVLAGLGEGDEEWPFWSGLAARLRELLSMPRYLEAVEGTGTAG